MSKNRNITLIKNTFILGIGQLIPKFMALITLPILTKHLSVNEYGIYDMILSVGSLAIPLMTLLIQQAAFRFIIDSNNDKAEIVTSTFGVFGILAVAWGIIIGGASFFGIYDKVFLLIMWILYLFESLYDIFGQIVRGLGKNFLFSCGVIIYSNANLFFVLFLLRRNDINIYSIILSSLMAYILAFLFIGVKGRVYDYIKIGKFSLTQVKRMLHYAIPIIPSSISLWVVNLSDRLLIISFLGASMNGVYAAANKIPNLCGIVYSVFNLAWTEMAARTVNDKDRDLYYTELYNSLFSFMTGCFMILIVVSPLVFNVLIDDKFSLGLQQMPILFAGIFFSSLVSFYGGIYVALKKTKQVGLSSVIGAILNLLINIFFIRKLGLFAASVSTVVSYYLIYVYRKIDVRKYIFIKLNRVLGLSGYLSLVIICVLYYINLNAMFVVGSVLAIVFNWRFNMPIFRKISNKIFQQS